MNYYYYVVNSNLFVKYFLFEVIDIICFGRDALVIGYYKCSNKQIVASIIVCI